MEVIKFNTETRKKLLGCDIHTLCERVTSICNRPTDRKVKGWNLFPMVIQLIPNVDNIVFFAGSVEKLDGSRQ